MATSGNTINQLSRDDLINAILRTLVVISEGTAPNANQLTYVTQAMNNVIAGFRTLGMSIWARKSLAVTMVNGQQSYTVGVGQPINVPYPLRIYRGTMEQAPYFDTKIDMNQLSFMDFDLLPNLSTGTPVNFMYQPQVNKGIISVWPTPDASVIPGTRITFLYQSPFEYFVSGVDTPDFPEEWNNAIIYQTALTCADQFGKPLQEKQWLEKQADKWLGVALQGGAEEASLYFTRDWSGDV